MSKCIFIDNYDTNFIIHTVHIITSVLQILYLRLTCGRVIYPKPLMFNLTVLTFSKPLRKMEPQPYRTFLFSTELLGLKQSLKNSIEPFDIV